jgi:hypothetical protein
MEKGKTRIHYQCGHIPQICPYQSKQCDFIMRNESRVVKEPVNGRHDHRWPIHSLIASPALLQS